MSKESEVKRLEAEYAKAAREHNQRAMELISPRLIQARKAQVAKKSK